MKLLKKIVPLTLSFVLVFSSITAFAQDVNLNLNGVVQDFETQPINEKGHLMVDGIEIGKMIGATTNWEENTKTLTMTKGENTAVFKDANSKYYLNGSEKYLNTTARMVDGKLFLPLGDVCKIFGATVRWDSKTNTVSIDTKDEYSFSEPIKPVIYEDTKVISYNKALGDALAYNSDIKNLNDNVALMEQQRKKTVEDYEDMIYTPIMPYSDSTAIYYMRQINTLETNSSDAKYKKEMIQTQTEAMLIDAINTISIYEIDIQMLKNVIAIQQQNLNNVTLKNTVGMASDNDVKNAKQQLEKSESSLNKLEIGLVSLKGNLNKLCGYPVGQDTYVEYAPDIKPVNVDIDSYAIGKTSDDPSIKLLQSEVEKAQYAVNTSVSTLENEESEEADKTDKVQTETALNTATRNLTDSKTNMEQSIFGTYNTLKSMEEEQKSLEIDLEKAKNDYNTAKVSLAAGTSTQFEVDSAETEIKRIQGEMLKNAYNYDTLTYKFEHPFLLSPASAVGI